MLRAEIETELGELRLDARLGVEPGACLALVGPSGSGKSSLLRSVAGLLRPRRGRVENDGDVWLDTARGIDVDPDRRRCGFVFQDYALFGHMSAWRNVAYGLPRLPMSIRRREALGLLDRFGVGRLADARPARLSGGERQRVALARALGSRPRALLLDEPLAALDAATRAKAIRELLSLMAEARVPALLVTHDFDQAAAIADRVAVLEAGRIVQEGEADELAAAPASAFVADLIGSIVLTGCASRRGDGLTQVELDGGGVAVSIDKGLSGPVAISIHPWDVTLEPARQAAGSSSARNRLGGRVTSATKVGNRVRVGVEAAQPLVAEVTPDARDELGLRPGVEVVATWKASATRVLQR